MRKQIFIIITLSLLLSTSFSHSSDSSDIQDNVDVETLNQYPIIGMHIGLAYSSVSIYKNGQAEIIPNEDGNKATPSIISISIDEQGTEHVLFGDKAKNNTKSNPKNTIYSFNNLIGRKFEVSTSTLS